MLYLVLISRAGERTPHILPLRDCLVVATNFIPWNGKVSEVNRKGMIGTTLKASKASEIRETLSSFYRKFGVSGNQDHTGSVKESDQFNYIAVKEAERVRIQRERMLAEVYARVSKVY